MRSSAKYIFWFLAVTFVGGFLLAESSGLLGRATVTPTTAVATVNGEEIPYNTWVAVSQNRSQEEEQRLGRALTLDERRRIDDEAFEQLVTSILLEQEYKKRDISVSPEEIVEAAQTNPPPQLLQSPELQTEGQFDLAKYKRFLASPAARQQGLLLQLENYYRNQIPQEKLYGQLASDVYVTDADMWRSYRDLHDSAQVSFVAFDPATVPDSKVSVGDAEIRDYYDKHKSEFERSGRAVVTVVSIPRVITAADTQAVIAHARQLRDEIVKGTSKFEDVAKRESADTVSGAQGGFLGRGPKGRFVKEFEDAAYALTPGTVSEPVKTPFGIHLIKVDERKGDTLAVRHILLRITQSDSSATRTDRSADSLSRMAASSDQPQKFDSAAKVLGLKEMHGTAVEGDPLVINGRMIPSVSAWAFGGAKVGETSDMFDSDDGYYLARLDTLSAGGQMSLDDAKATIRQKLLADKKLDALMPDAQAFAKQAAQTSLDAAAKAKGLKVEQTPLFNRLAFVPGLGRFDQAIGAAFALPQGAVSAPVKSDGNVVVLRVDKRIDANRAEFEKQKDEQRRQMVQALRQQRVRTFLAALRKEAKVDDNRKKILAAGRRES
jgi:peptidyl-prolyl cis-trans isomerase D